MGNLGLNVTKPVTANSQQGEIPPMAKPEAELKKFIKKGDLEAVKQIIADGVPVDVALPAKVTALEFALASEQREIVWELLRLGAKPRKNKNNNLLLDVPKFRDLKLLKRLIELGADIHDGDKNQLTPVLCAVQAGFFDAVNHLLELGADPTTRTKNGQNAFQLAHGTRQFCRGLLPSSDGELAELFQSQLDDLDRIEQLLESQLTPEQAAQLRGGEKKPEPSTFWQLDDYAEFELKISPFPFTSTKKSRFCARMGREGDNWLKHFEDDWKILYRVRSADREGEWTPFELKKLDGFYLLFTAAAQLPSGRITIDIRFDADWDHHSGEVEGWEIEVA